MEGYARGQRAAGPAVMRLAGFTASPLIRFGNRGRDIRRDLFPTNSRILLRIAGHQPAKAGQRVRSRRA
jgi:hypothetical protein